MATTKNARKGRTKIRSRSRSTKSRSSKSRSKISSRRGSLGNVRNTLLKVGNVSGVKLPVDEIKTQLMTYADQIQGYLGNVNAKIETFNFGVDKSEDGITIDCHVRADIGGQTS